jgi:1-aminocyclopropane-1-carboxylate deaminase/D-cysteine desulfhydrase-like pyridoxal-dependent ACC family enzyme
MKKFIIETLQVFHETHVVEAESEEVARKIVEHSDYNTSKHIGQSILTVRNFSMTEIERLLNEDKYFFKGYASLDEEGYLVYKSLDEKFKPNMEPRKIFL